MDKPLSPITHTKAVVLEENFTVAEIVAAYRSESLEVADYFKGLNEVNLFRCEATGYRFYYPYSIIGNSTLYDQLQKRTDYYTVEKWEHTQALEMIATNKAVLEVGCGNGNFLERLRAKGVKNSIGLEFSDDAILSATNKGLNVIKQTIQNHAEQHPDQYDVVCFFQVLEHIDDIHSFMTAAVKSLKKGGKLIIGVPNSNPYLYKYDRLHSLNLPPHHMGLWSDEALRNIAPYFGLNIEEVHTEKLIWQYRSQYRNAMINHYKKHNNLIAKFLQIIPAFVFKSYLSVSEAAAEGRHLLAIYNKK